MSSWKFIPKKEINKKNLYDIPKQKGEIRVVSCDMAFIQGEKNDNSIYSCSRLLPDYTTFDRNSDANVRVENGYRRVVSYIESKQGGDVPAQARRIRQIFEDFQADFLVLDTRNAGRNAALYRNI